MRCGKLIVAHDDTELQELQSLHAKGVANGVEDLRIVDRDFMVAREPAISGTAAIWSPVTGIVNAEELVKALLRDGRGCRRRVSAGHSTPRR